MVLQKRIPLSDERIIICSTTGNSNEFYSDFCFRKALYRNEDSAMLQNFAASVRGNCPSAHNRKAVWNSAGSGLRGRPKRIPFSFAAAMPSACRFRIFSRSFCATNDNTCNTRSAMNAPSKSLLRLVSSKGMSSTTISTFFSLVIIRHCCWISS